MSKIGEILSQLGSNWKNIKEKMYSFRLPELARFGSSKILIPKREVNAANYHPRKMLLMGLVAALALVKTIPAMTLQSDKKILTKMKKARVNGLLSVSKFTEGELEKIRKIAGIIPTELLRENQVKPLIIDTGASSLSTGDKTDFVKGTLTKLERPLNMGGIAGKLQATHKGLVKLEYVNDNGQIGTIEGTGLFLEGLQCRLYSPQTHFRELRSQDKHGAMLKVLWNCVELKLPNQPGIKIDYDDKSNLPVLQCFDSAELTAKSLTMTGCVTDELNQNITSLQKLLLQWHFKLGHIGFAVIKWIG